MTARPAFHGSKAATLRTLKGLVRNGIVLDQLSFDLAQWRTDPDGVTTRVLSTFGADRALAVRSSTHLEDGETASLAGRFLSRLDVIGEAALREAIDVVTASYGDQASDPDEVLIQAMVRAPAFSGVATSREPGTGRPYRIVSYTESGDTAAVSGGREANVKTFHCHRAHDTHAPGPVLAILALLRELEELFGRDDLDIEFACPADGLPVLLQCRCLVNLQRRSLTDGQHAAALEAATRQLQPLLERQPFVAGRNSMLGMMADWNPAEMIGVRPRPLAYSLYRRLITDATWAAQRARYGYRDLRGHRLMIDILGIPFIDVRASFNSFVPAALPQALADKLIDHYMARLRAYPEHHDKVEFEVVASCFAFDTSTALDRLATIGFDADDRRQIADALLDITRAALDPRQALQQRCRDELATLETRYARLQSAPLASLPLKIHWLLDDCCRYGTLPFAGLARTAFIAFKMLRSMQAVGILAREEVDAFVCTVNSVARQARLTLRDDPGTFLQRYGHLRPGTYDIRVPRYDEAFDVYFGADSAATPEEAPTAPFVLCKRQRLQIDSFLRRHAFDMDADRLFDAIRTALEEREQAKLLFSRHVSDALTCIEQLGRQHGLSANDMSFAGIRFIEELPFDTRGPDAALRAEIERGRAAHQLTEDTILPPLLFEHGSLMAFHMPATEPNFVTAGQCIGLVRTPAEPAALDGAIVAIPHADPGYDWIFARRIAGLITAYGGVNSHMALRAGEAGIPAVIGAGPVLFEQWSNAKMLRIDCANRTVQVLR